MLVTIDGPKRKTNRTEKAAYEKVRRAELQYGIKLRKIARTVGEIVGLYPPGDPSSVNPIMEWLRKYAELITPWAQITAAGMLADVNYREQKHWNELATNMGAALRQELKRAPTGETFARLQLEQVRLIRSIPLEAAQRVHKLTMEGMISSKRYEEVKRDILRTTGVTESRATLIAITEVGRASSNLTQARAEHIGSDSYVWRTARDSDVRESHRKLEGTVHKWSSPPICDPPAYRAHPGCIWRCRCYPEPIIPDIFR